MRSVSYTVQLMAELSTFRDMRIEAPSKKPDSPRSYGHMWLVSHGHCRFESQTHLQHGDGSTAKGAVAGILRMDLHSSLTHNSDYCLSREFRTASHLHDIKGMGR